MTGKEFMNRVTNSKNDFLQIFIDIMKGNKIRYCVVGGLGVNAYAEPVVSLDLDVVVISESIKELTDILKKKFTTEEYTHSINISEKESDLRIQIQTDEEYQPFISRAVEKEIFGYKLSVALIEDIFQGKIWAYMDKERRESKRQKDLADIMRLIEVKEELMEILPKELREKIGK